MGEMKRLTGQMHSRLVIVVFPYEPQLEQFNRVKDTEYILKPQKRIDALCQKYDVPCLDVFPAFHEKKEDAKLFRDGIHLTKEGHELTAALIYPLKASAIADPQRRRWFQAFYDQAAWLRFSKSARWAKGVKGRSDFRLVGVSADASAT